MSRMETMKAHWSKAASAMLAGNENRRNYMPWGFIPTVGLCATVIFALFHFSTQIVEKTAERSAREALSAIGANWAKVSASGQWVTIEGEAPTAEMARAAGRAVKAATASSPFGFRTRPVTRVNNQATILPGPNAGLAPAILARHDWSYTLDRGVMTLTGKVPSEEIKAKILEAAELRLEPPRFTAVENQLMVTGRSSQVGFEATATRGVNTLSRCDVGTASFSEAVFTLSCEAQPVRIDEISMLANAPLEYGSAGRLDVFSAEEAEACDRSLMDLLNSARVEFASSSATIDPVSTSLLDDVAEAATRCPGTLLIEGHTDSSGLQETNDTLSVERAYAVRAALIERGIEASRLKATGFGARQPVADNDTPNGRARNRRIEIKVDRAND